MTGTTPKTFTIVYRTGGREHCEWKRVLEAYPTREATREKCDEIERMGYRTLVFVTSQLDAIGMPEGWTA